MSEKKESSEAYHNLRSGFDGLEVDEQARFLVEAAMSMVANGAREAGNVVSKVVDDIVENVQNQCDDDEAEDADDAAEAKEEKPAPKKRATRSRKKADDKEAS